MSVKLKPLDLRRTALLRKAESEPIDAPLRITAPHEWAIVTAFVLALVAAGVWGVFGRVEINLVVDGILVRPGERSAIVSPVSGRVLDVPVKRGDAVAAGAPVATVEPAGLDMQARIARTQEDLLADLIARSGGAAEGVLRAALAELQAERLELAAIETAGRTIVNPGAGEITATYVVAGDAVAAGDTIAGVRAEAAGDVTVATLLTPEQARTVQPGMPAHVIVETPVGGRLALEGEVLAVAAAGSSREWLRATLLAPGRENDDGRSHLVTLAVTGYGEHLPIEDLWSCRVEIVRERVRPLALLAPMGES